MTAPLPQHAANGRGRAHPDPQFILLCIAVSVEAFGIGVLFPLLAKIQAAHHLPTYGLGLMSGANFFTALATQVTVTRFLDGRRARLVLLSGMVIATGSFVWFAAAGSLLELTVSRALGGVGFGIVLPAALRAGTVGRPVAEHGGRIGRISSAEMIGIVLGPLFGVAVYAIGGLAAPFVALAALSAMVTVALAFTGRPAEPGVAAIGDEQVRPEHPSPRPALGPIVGLLLLSAAAQAPTGLYDALWSRLMTDRGASTFLIGLSLALFGVPIAVLAPFGGRMASRMTPWRATAVALVITAGFMASYGFVPSPVAITILGVLESCAQSVAVPGGYAAVAAVFPDDWAATGQGWFTGAGTAAAGTAALVGAPAYAASGPGTVFAGGAVVSVALVGASVLIARRASPRLAST